MTSPSPQAPDFPTISLVKIVINDANGVGKAKPSNFTLQAIGPVTVSGRGGSANITNQDVPAGRYELREFGDAVTTGYSPSVWTCTGNFTETGTNYVILAPEQNAVCSITNTYTGVAPITDPYADTDPYANVVTYTDLGPHANARTYANTVTNSDSIPNAEPDRATHPDVRPAGPVADRDEPATIAHVTHPHIAGAVRGYRHPRARHTGAGRHRR